MPDKICSNVARFALYQLMCLRWAGVRSAPASKENPSFLAGKFEKSFAVRRERFAFAACSPTERRGGGEGP
jgi:hypothetical protein